jgi:poly-gamma-glutamate capsule biosynthesis protein CapA/YwtB (metallophosphatase superfamily)
LYRQILMGILVLANTLVLNASSREAFSVKPPADGKSAPLFVAYAGPSVPTAPPVKPEIDMVPVPAAEATVETEIVVSFAGDCTLGTDPAFRMDTSFPARLKQQKGDYAYFFKGVRPVFAADDLTLVNLETTLTTASQMAAKKFRFKGDPSYVRILQEGSIEMVNIANNHIHDFLDRGFKDTLQALKDGSILYSGEGNITIHTVKGIRIASLGYTGWDDSGKKRLCEDIEKARREAELVAVSFHWGEERVHYPNKVQKELGRLCIDLGADIVVGHHPHVLQGVELYKGKYIVYSLGNFCFGGNANPSDKDTMIFQGLFSFREKKVEKIEGRMIPCSISSVKKANDYQPVLLEGREAERVLQRLYEYSSKLEYGIRPAEESKDKAENSGSHIQESFVRDRLRISDRILDKDLLMDFQKMSRFGTEAE